MNEAELAKLETLTKDYAAFQAHKSGLGTALGGVLALLMFLVYCALIPLSTVFRVSQWTESFVRMLILLVYAAPVLWVILNPLLGRFLYHGLGEVKPRPDASHERQRWYWAFSIAMLLLAFQTVALLAFVNGFLEYLGRSPSAELIPSTLSARWKPWLWVGALPWVYALLAPLSIRGREEAKAYAVLVGQGILWMVVGFAYRGLNYHAGSEASWQTAWFLLQLLILVWAVQAIVRGWKEHREYLSILRNISGEVA